MGSLIEKAPEYNKDQEAPEGQESIRLHSDSYVVDEIKSPNLDEERDYTKAVEERAFLVDEVLKNPLPVKFLDDTMEVIGAHADAVERDGLGKDSSALDKLIHQEIQDAGDIGNGPLGEWTQKLRGTANQKEAPMTLGQAISKATHSSGGDKLKELRAQKIFGLALRESVLGKDLVKSGETFEDKWQNMPQDEKVKVRVAEIAVMQADAEKMHMVLNNPKISAERKEEVRKEANIVLTDYARTDDIPSDVKRQFEDAAVRRVGGSTQVLEGKPAADTEDFDEKNHVILSEDRTKENTGTRDTALKAAGTEDTAIHKSEGKGRRGRSEDRIAKVRESEERVTRARRDMERGRSKDASDLDDTTVLTQEDEAGMARDAMGETKEFSAKDMRHKIDEEDTVVTRPEKKVKVAAESPKHDFFGKEQLGIKEMAKLEQGLQKLLDHDPKEKEDAAKNALKVGEYLFSLKRAGVKISPETKAVCKDKLLGVRGLMTEWSGVTTSRYLALLKSSGLDEDFKPTAHEKKYMVGQLHKFIKDPSSPEFAKMMINLSYLDLHSKGKKKAELDEALRQSLQQRIAGDDKEDVLLAQAQAKSLGIDMERKMKAEEVQGVLNERVAQGEWNLALRDKVHAEKAGYEFEQERDEMGSALMGQMEKMSESPGFAGYVADVRYVSGTFDEAEQKARLFTEFDKMDEEQDQGAGVLGVDSEEWSSSVWDDAIVLGGERAGPDDETVQALEKQSNDFELTPDEDADSEWDSSQVVNFGDSAGDDEDSLEGLEAVAASVKDSDSLVMVNDGEAILSTEAAQDGLGDFDEIDFGDFRVTPEQARESRERGVAIAEDEYARLSDKQKDELAMLYRERPANEVNEYVASYRRRFLELYDAEAIARAVSASDKELRDGQAVVVDDAEAFSGKRKGLLGWLFGNRE